MIRGRDVLWNLDAPTAVNNRKREAADSAEILDDRPDRDDQREPNPPRGAGRAEKGKCDGAQAGLLTVSRRKFGKKREEAILHFSRRLGGRPENYVIGGWGGNGKGVEGLFFRAIIRKLVVVSRWSSADSPPSLPPDRREGTKFHSDRRPSTDTL